MKRTLHLKGPYSGQVIDMADADAATGVTDGWARDITGLSQPFDSSGEVDGAAFTWPNSLKVWLMKIGYPPRDEYPGAVKVACVSIDKTNPAVIEVSATDIGTFNNGDQVFFTGTGTALDSAGILVVAAKSVPSKTFTVAVNLTALPAKLVGVGSVTKLA